MMTTSQPHLYIVIKQKRDIYHRSAISKKRKSDQVIFQKHILNVTAGGNVDPVQVVIGFGRVSINLEPGRDGCTGKLL